MAQISNIEAYRKTKKPYWAIIDYKDKVGFVGYDDSLKNIVERVRRYEYHATGNRDIYIVYYQCCDDGVDYERIAYQWDGATSV